MLQICKTHFDKLKDAATLRGMGHYWDHAPPEDGSYYPPLSIAFSLASAAVSQFGTDLATRPTLVCPLCAAVENGKDESEWIESPLAVSWEECKRLGLWVAPLSS